MSEKEPTLVGATIEFKGEQGVIMGWDKHEWTDTQGEEHVLEGYKVKMEPTEMTPNGLVYIIPPEDINIVTGVAWG